MSGEYVSEVKITSAMIEAGVSVYLDRDLRFESEADVVAAIYRAMVKVISGPRISSQNQESQ